MNKLMKHFCFLLVMVALAACGTAPSGSGTGGTGGSDTLTLTLTDTLGNAITSIPSGGTATVTAALLDSSGQAIAGSSITFGVDANFGTIAGSGVVTTNANGIATAILTAGSNVGSSTISAASTTASASIAYSVAVGAMTLAIIDSSGNPVTSVTFGTPVNVTATLLDPLGNPVANQVVSFSNNPAIGTLTPTTALSNGSGIAVVSLDAASVLATGADVVTASAQIGTAAVSANASYSVGLINLTLSALRFGANPLSANGSTSVAVDVLAGGVPITAPVSVDFSSGCTAIAKATITTPVQTVASTATANYSDLGCASIDTVTATVLGVSQTGSLTVSPPSAGAIQFVSAVPSQISLKGIGGIETSQVTFVVNDAVGNPVSGAAVDFTLDTTVGGISLSRANDVSDSNGVVFTNVNSGTVSTPVRVTATTTGLGGFPIQTVSDALTITTGIPDQDSASLSATTLNLEGWDVDGVTTTLTMRLSDHFNNPVPDGTPVNFTTEGGQIISTCATADGVCSVPLNSSNPRPADGRLTVLAFAVGEESFIDLDGDGLADAPAELFDINFVSTDLGEAFVDFNEDGLRDPMTEPFIDFNSDGTFQAVGDGLYNGVLCDEANGSAAGTCPPGTPKLLHVRGDIVLIFSGSSPFLEPVSPTPIDLGACGLIVDDGVLPGSVSFQFLIYDENQNAMPAGTTINWTTDNGTLSGTSSWVVPNTIANRSWVPTPSVFLYNATIRTDATEDPGDPTATPSVPASCSDPTPGGNLTVTVQTPLGLTTVIDIPVIN